MNSFTRFKLSLTEDKPTIKPYYEERWAELADSKNIPVEYALQMLDGLHARWTILLKSLNEKDLEKCFVHPEKVRKVKLKENIALYAWHCDHHLAHVTSLKKSKGW